MNTNPRKGSAVKRSVMYLGLAGLIALSAPSYAVDAHHPDQAGAAAPGQPAMGADATLKQMRANAKRMQTQLDRIAATKDPNQRQQMMQEHMQTLNQHMSAASAMAGMGPGGKAMAGGGMMGAEMMGDCPMMGGGMMGMGKSGMGGADDMMARRMDMMEKRMDMMQTMMDMQTRQQRGFMEPQTK